MLVTVEKRKRKRGTAVLLSYLDNQGKRRRKVVGTAATPEPLKVILEEADRQRKRIEHELAEGTLRPKLGEEGIEVALLEFMGHQAASSVKESTVRGYKETLKKWRVYLNTTDARRLKDITPRLIVGYVKSQNGKAPDTIGGDLTKLQRIFRHFVDREAIAVNPFKHPTVKEVWPQSVKHERCFTNADFTCFMEEARKPSRSPQNGDYADLFALLAESGLRLGEALHLRWCDIAFGHEEGSYLRVQPWGEWSPKTKKSVRNVPLTPAVEAMLRTRLRAKADVDPKACIFPLNWTLRSVNQHFNRVLKRACLHERDEREQKLRPHSFRHYYASILVRSGADPATVRDLLGHDSITTTNRYFNVPRSELFGAVAGAFSRTRSVHESSGVYRFPAEIGGINANA